MTQVPKATCRVRLRTKGTRIIVLQNQPDIYVWIQPVLSRMKISHYIFNKEVIMKKKVLVAALSGALAVAMVAGIAFAGETEAST